MDPSLDSRRRWFEEYIDRVEHGVSAPPQAGMRYPCPCCGYPTLLERGSYEICELCNWEDDGQDDPHADEVWGGPNGAYSLSEARANFKQYLIMYSPDDLASRINASDSPMEQQAKRAIMAAFDAMLTEADPQALNALWQRVFANEQILQRELQRKVREHEARMRDQDAS
ncbi:MAG: hypothetical protein M3220_14365 [Chloroflexota bacterium]|nr:hypothetical protein [Chloroflexota bacterium]